MVFKDSNTLLILGFSVITVQDVINKASIKGIILIDIMCKCLNTIILIFI